MTCPDLAAALGTGRGVFGSSEVCKEGDHLPEDRRILRPTAPAAKTLGAHPVNYGACQPQPPSVAKVGPKCNKRKKDGKVHRYRSVMESYRLHDGRSAKRQVLYLGEINDSQKLSWRKTIAAFEGKAKQPRQVALFPRDRQPPERLPGTVLPVQVDRSRMELRRPRQWGACWLALELWEMLGLGDFFTPRLPASRKGTRWDLLLKLLVCARLIKPSSEWYLHREGYRQSAMANLLGMEPEVVPKNPLYECHDKLLEHKEALFRHLSQRWQDLLGARHEVLLYDLTSTYFECDPPAEPGGSKKRFGYSRDKRSDCVQVVIALIVTPEGYPLAYEVMAGNTQDNQTLRASSTKLRDSTERPSASG